MLIELLFFRVAFLTPEMCMGRGQRSTESYSVRGRLCIELCASLGLEEIDVRLIAESQDAVYALFMKAHKCYDLIPTSTKLVVFDTQLPVCRHTFVISWSALRFIAQA